MCGIAGYWGSGDRAILERMGNSLTHRGPDAGGVVQVGSVGLAHRRLSIVDLSPTGSQPMQNRAGTVSLIFNGEIYNHKALRETYLSEVAFAGSSDTEVILHLYEKLGEACFEKLSGMFAIALYDSAKNVLILARDRMGKKPLYYTQVGTALIFGSELKALRKHPLCPHEMSRDAILEYLVYEYIPAPHTIYKDVYKLLPGTYLTYDGATIAHHIFSEIQVSHGTYSRDFQNAKKDLYELLDAAVTKRMVADVPVGVFLSGGLDSSTVAHFAQQATESQVKTFSIGFKDSSFDESGYARDVAIHLGTDHHERVVGPDDLLQIIHQIPDVLDEPMADSSIIPTLLLSEFTRAEVKVALGGDGADELFWGYDTFFAHKIGFEYEKIPKFIQKGILSISNHLPVSHSYMSFDFKVKKFLSGFDTTRARRNTYWLSAFTPAELKSIILGEIDESVLLASSDSRYKNSTYFWDNLQSDYLQGYLAEEILVKADRASMAHGLEVRAPFLDLDVVNFALTLSPRDKYHGLTAKYILKETMRAYLPAHIIDRPKKGFGVPIGSWIQGPLHDFVRERLLGGALAESGLFNNEQLAILLESHLNGKADHRKKLWSLLVLDLWMGKWKAESPV